MLNNPPSPRTPFHALLVALAVLLAFHAPSQAQYLAAPVARVVAESGTVAEGETVEAPPPGAAQVEADRFEYDENTGLFIGIGNVIIKHQEAVLTADYVEYNTISEDSLARGSVVFQDATRKWTGEELRYNFGTRQGDFGTFEFYQAPWYVRADHSERIDDNVYRLDRAMVTTCEGERPDFFIRARESTIINGERVEGKHATIHLFRVPVFYWPRFSRNLEGDRWEFVPGYSGRMGAFLLSTYNYRINTHLQSRTHIDARTKRGLAAGQDILWEDPAGTYQGIARVYYADDQKPFRDEEEELRYGELVDSDRYRLQLKHQHTFSPRDFATVELNYLSDPRVIEEFFDDEYRQSPQPENRATFLHRQDFYTASVELNRRMNDFYDSVNRLPEFRFEVPQLQLGESGFYYDSGSSLSFLERVYREGSDNEDYDAIRFDSRHMLLYPSRHFGFLNVIPRAGYRLTYYSDTRSSFSVTNTVIEVDEFGVETEVEEVETFTVNEGADFRNLYEIGLETSFKAFGVVHEQPTIFGDGLRHVIEPFANYTYVPEPNLLPENIYQFDGIDSLGERNFVTLGVRNKWQTRNNKYIRDLVYVEVASDLRFNTRSDEDAFSPLRVDFEFTPSDRFRIDSDARYNFYDSNLETFNTRGSLLLEDRTRFGLEYRFTDPNRSLFAFDAHLFPELEYSLYTYWRYDFEESELEESRYMITRKTPCLSYSLGVKIVDEDTTVFAQLWLSAFPRSDPRMGR